MKHHKYIDAALHYQGSREHPESHTYLFQDEWVYLWDSDKKTSNPEDHWPKGAVADGWPRKIKDVFPGVPNKIDTAFNYYFDDRVYFFKDRHFKVLKKNMQNKRDTDRHKYKVKPGKKPTKEIFKNICNVKMCVDDLTKPCLAAWPDEF